MALPQVTSSTSTLKGAREVNYVHMAMAYQDVGGKIAALISSVNLLNTSVSSIYSALISANASGVTFSVFSGVTLSATAGTISNFSS
jgi:hypothetical protein